MLDLSMTCGRLSSIHSSTSARRDVPHGTCTAEICFCHSKMGPLQDILLKMVSAAATYLSSQQCLPFACQFQPFVFT